MEFIQAAMLVGAIDASLFNQLALVESTLKLVVGNNSPSCVSDYLEDLSDVDERLSFLLDKLDPDMITALGVFGYTRLEVLATWYHAAVKEAECPCPPEG